MGKVNELFTGIREVCAMANHIVHALKRFAVSTAIRWLPAKPALDLAPEPLFRSGDDIFARDERDDWMFDAPSSSVSPAVEALSGELSRVSSALSDLRSLLSSIMTHAPIPEVQVSAAAENFNWADDALFEGYVPDAAFEVAGASVEDAFLFDDDHTVTTDWTPLRPALPSMALSA